MDAPGRQDIRVAIAARTAMRPTLRDAAARAGLEIAAECADAAQLLDAVAREHPGLCILDRELRGGGLVAAASIAAPHPAPKVLVVGGRGAAAEVRAARLAGAADCVPGDIDAAELAAAVTALVKEEEQ